MISKAEAKVNFGCYREKYLSKENSIGPNVLISAVIWGKLRIYTLHEPPRVLWKLASCNG